VSRANFDKISPAKTRDTTGKKPVRKTHFIFDAFAKGFRKDGFVKSSPAKAGQCAQRLRNEAHLQGAGSDEFEAQSRSEQDRWTF